MTLVGSRTLLSRSHVSSMTGGSPCPIYYQRVVSGEERGVIIRYKLTELIKKVSWADPHSPAAMFQAWLWWGIEPCSLAAIFQE